jgi:hypothetical protein
MSDALTPDSWTLDSLTIDAGTLATLSLMKQSFILKSGTTRGNAHGPRCVESSTLP